MSVWNTPFAVFRFIIIIISLIIIILPVPGAYAYDFLDEDIWVYQGSFNIGADERADAGEYTIKIHEVHMEETPPSAVVLVYKKKVYQDVFFVDAVVNNEYIFDNELKVHVLGIKEGKVSVELHRHEYERVWIPDIPKTPLQVGEVLKSGDCTLIVSGFTEEGVELLISKNGTVVKNTYNTGDFRKYFDDILVKVTYVNPERDKAFVEIYRPGHPHLEVGIKTDRSTYNPNEVIRYDVDIINSGTVPIRGIVLAMSASDGTIDRPVQKCYMIEPSLSYMFTVNVVPPVTPLGTDFTVKADVTGYDYSGATYANSTAFDTHVNSYIAIEKHLQSNEISLNRMIYDMQEPLTVTLTIHNMGNVKTPVHVNDALPDSFMPVDVESLEWSLVVDADSSREITYRSVPTRPGSFTLEPASLEWMADGETYHVESADSNMVSVHGVMIVADRSLSSSVVYTTEAVDVTITLTNEGDIGADVKFTDTVPEGVKMIAGENHWSGSLDAGESKEITYTIRTEEAGEFSLPEIEVSFVDVDGYQGSSRSNPVKLYVDEKTIPVGTETATEVETNAATATPYGVAPTADLTGWEAAGFLLSSFITLVSILAIAPIAAYLLITRLH